MTQQQSLPLPSPPNAIGCNMSSPGLILNLAPIVGWHWSTVAGLDSSTTPGADRSSIIHVRWLGSKRKANRTSERSKFYSLVGSALTSLLSARICLFEIMHINWRDKLVTLFLPVVMSHITSSVSMVEWSEWAWWDRVQSHNPIIWDKQINIMTNFGIYSQKLWTCQFWMACVVQPEELELESA